MEELERKTQHSPKGPLSYETQEVPPQPFLKFQKAADRNNSQNTESMSICLFIN